MWQVTTNGTKLIDKYYRFTTFIKLQVLCKQNICCLGCYCSIWARQTSFDNVQYCNNSKVISIIHNYQPFNYTIFQKETRRILHETNGRVISLLHTCIVPCTVCLPIKYHSKMFSCLNVTNWREVPSTKQFINAM